MVGLDEGAGDSLARARRGGGCPRDGPDRWSARPWRGHERSRVARRRGLRKAVVGAVFSARLRDPRGVRTREPVAMLGANDDGAGCAGNRRTRDR